MTDLQPKLLELFRHPGPAIAAKTEAMLFADMRQQRHIAALAPTGPIDEGAVAGAMPAARDPSRPACGAGVLAKASLRTGQ